MVLADRARGRNEGIARKRAVEVLLYAAGRRQIDRALAMGLTEGTTAAVVLADAEGSGTGSVEVHDGRPEASEVGTDDPDPPEERERATLAAVCDLAWFEPGPVTLGDPERLRAFFDVGEAELAATDAALADLVRERVALLVVDR
ncbi:KEOPS complex component [Halobacteriales archaeon SW_12_71_31]|nr:MAG: KEOPS complex component [Halobacteriales archaeon SW_12_71_31]